MTRSPLSLMALSVLFALNSTMADSLDARNSGRTSAAGQQSSSMSVDARSGPYIVVLGVTQDAGFPQAGCYEPHCMPGWQFAEARRGPVSLGLVTAERKFLFEATPDLPNQLYQLEQLAPSKSHPLAGIFLTHAHIGHYTGLMFLGHESMGARNVPVYAMPRMRQFLENNGPWSQLVTFDNIALEPLSDKLKVKLERGLSVMPFLVPHRDEFSETVGFRIESDSHSAVFIPDINKWEDWDVDLRSVVRENDYVLIDAAFFADGELPGRDMSKIPHPFVSETMALLSALARNQRNKVWFIHMNHTNPLLQAGSDETLQVKKAGFNVAREGVILKLHP